MDSILTKNDFINALIGSSHISGRKKYRENFVSIMNQNIKVADDLLAESKRLSKAGKTKESDRMLDIALKVLNSNKELQSTVVEVLSKLD